MEFTHVCYANFFYILGLNVTKSQLTFFCVDLAFIDTIILRNFF
jgi:hypothetical protein